MHFNQRPMVNRTPLALGIALAIAGLPAIALAQASGDDLMGLSGGALQDAVQSRYAAALAMTQDAAVVAADNTHFTWASQAKAQCGIALGFLKSGTKDPVSIGKCADAAMRMQMQDAPPPLPLAMAPVSTVPDEVCRQAIAGIVFFDFDSATAPDSAGQTLDAVNQNMRSCGWQSLTVTGHTDRSGSDAYNDALSVRRAQAVAGLLASRGVAQGSLIVAGHGETEPKVPTPDGERNPTNRRVEITAK